MNQGFVAGVAAFVFGVIAVPLSAQSADPYAECAAIHGDASRLACFDSTYARERERQTERREKESERSAAAFGFTPAQIREGEEQLNGSAAGAAASSEPDEGMENREESLSAEIAKVFTDAAGRPVVLLTNGQLWEATSSGSFRGTVRPGWHATVTKSWSGGFRMKFDEQSGFLSVRRIR